MGVGGMLEFITGFGVPAGVFVLMLIAGTEVHAADFQRVAQHPRAVLLGAVGQLAVLPALGLLIGATVSLEPSVAAGLLMLSLCPGGAISNYYTYLARCSVPLSATITAVGTICSIASIPLWLGFLSGVPALNLELLEVPASRILAQLAAFMILPMAFGMIALRAFPDAIRQRGQTLRRVSFAIVLAVLLLAAWAVRGDIVALSGDIALAAVLFIAGAMLLGQTMSYGMKLDEGPVLVIESAARNVGIALIVGRSMLGDQSFATFAGFLTGYFVIEMLLLLAYAQFVRSRMARAATPV